MLADDLQIQKNLNQAKEYIKSKETKYDEYSIYELNCSNDRLSFGMLLFFVWIFSLLMLKRLSQK